MNIYYYSVYINTHSIVVTPLTDLKVITVNGAITVKSELNKGSEFIIKLPSYLVDEKNDTSYSDNYLVDEHLERIHIEFSDIYY